MYYISLFVISFLYIAEILSMIYMVVTSDKTKIKHLRKLKLIK